MNKGPSRRTSPSKYYLTSIFAVALGFINLLLLQTYTSGFYKLSSIALIIWGILFFTLALGSSEKHQHFRHLLRRIFTLILFVAILTDKYLHLEEVGIFNVAITITILWILFRSITQLKTKNEAPIEHQNHARIPTGLRIISLFHYVLGVTGFVAGAYLLLNPGITVALGESRLDIIMGVFLTGLINILVGFALIKGSIVIKWFGTLIWGGLLARILHLIWLEGTFTLVYVPILVPAVLIVDYFVFNKHCKTYFEQMS